jgi:hypothetical protein
MATITTQSTGSIAVGATWTGGSVPAITDDAVVAHACTLPGASVQFNSLKIDNVAGGTLTVSGTSTITVTTKVYTGTAAAHCITLATNANLTITGNFESNTSSLFRGIMSSGAGWRLHVTGNFSNLGNGGYGLRCSNSVASGGLVIDGQIISGGINSARAIYCDSNISPFNYTGTIINNTAVTTSGYSYGVDVVTGGVINLTGDTYGSGRGWAIRVDGGTATQIGNAYINDSAHPGIINGCDAVDVNGGTFTLHGNIYSSNGDFGVGVRNVGGKANIYGTIYHEQVVNDSEYNGAVRIEAGTGEINIYGSVIPTANSAQCLYTIYGGTVNIFGDCTGKFNISGGTLNTYGSVTSSSFNNSGGTWNYYGTPTVSPTPGNSNRNLDNNEISFGAIF